MSVFTDGELEYFGKQRLGRLATVDSAGNPRVVPVGFRYNAGSDTIDIGGHRLAQSRKWEHAGRHPRVAFVVDDVLPPWQPRSIEILADAERLPTGGADFGLGFDQEVLRLHPVRVIAWGIDGKRANSRRAKEAKES